MVLKFIEKITKFMKFAVFFERVQDLHSIFFGGPVLSKLQRSHWGHPVELWNSEDKDDWNPHDALDNPIAFGTSYHPFNRSHSDQKLWEWDNFWQTSPSKRISKTIQGYLVGIESRWWFSNICYFHPDVWGDDPIWLEHIFQLSWFNHNGRNGVGYFFHPPKKLTWQWNKQPWRYIYIYISYEKMGAFPASWLSLFVYWYIFSQLPKFDTSCFSPWHKLLLWGVLSANFEAAYARYLERPGFTLPVVLPSQVEVDCIDTMIFGNNILVITPRKFNLAPEELSSQKEISLPTTIFQGLC